MRQSTLRQRYRERLRRLSLQRLIGLCVLTLTDDRIRAMTCFEKSMHTWFGLPRSLLPLGMMAAGDLGVLIASRYGKISIVTTLTGPTRWSHAAVRDARAA
jgi:hypothetical protein